MKEYRINLNLYSILCVFFQKSKDQLKKEFVENKKYEFIFRKNCSFESLSSAIESNTQQDETGFTSRSLSTDDVNILYKDQYIDVEEADGSKGFINMDGNLNMDVVLKGDFHYIK
jgi:hypothetical protein